MQLLVEYEARVTPRVFYFNREIATARELDCALEVRARDVRLAAERRRAQGIENPKVTVQRTVLVSLIECQGALENCLDPGKLGDGRPVLARRVECSSGGFAADEPKSTIDFDFNVDRREAALAFGDTVRAESVARRAIAGTAKADMVDLLDRAMRLRAATADQ